MVLYPYIDCTYWTGNHRFDPFASNPSVQSSRPPTFTSNASALTPDRLMTHKLRRITHSSVFNVGVNAGRDSTQTSRSPTFTSNVTPAPSYTSQDPSTHEYHGRWTTLSAIVRSALAWILSFSSGVTSVIRRRPLGPRYIYYRVYAEDGAIPSTNPVFWDDPYLGRILANLVTPPHLVINLKNSLSGFENIDGSVPTSLFVATSSQTPMDDTAGVSILEYPGPGCTSDKPMALLAAFSSSEPTPDIVTSEIAVDERTPHEIRYIYYRFYNNRGAVRSKLPVDSNDPYIGRILVDIVPPPHTAQSIIRCISKVEKPEPSSQLQLFASISSKTPIGGGLISILASDCPGSTPEDPMAVVEVPPPFPAYPDFTQPLFVKRSYNPGSSNGWLIVTAGAILYTNNEGVKSRSLETYNSTTGQSFYIDYVSFEAINSDGILGFVRSTDVEPH